MNDFLTSNEWQWRLLRTISQGVLGVVVANVDLRQVYGAVSLDAARSALERLEERWAKYPGAVNVWKRNFRHVEQLFGYGRYTRRAMYTTNAIESVNSSLRKVTKKGTF